MDVYIVDPLRDFLKRQCDANPVIDWFLATDGEFQINDCGDYVSRTIREGKSNPQLKPIPDWFPDKARLIGGTGYDPEDRRSTCGGADFDSMSHAAGLSDDRLQEIIDACQSIPWLRIQRSKGGSGIHLYWRWDPDDRPRAHTTDQHYDNNMRVMLLVERLTGLRLVDADLDCCGRNLWLWTDSPKPGSFAPIKDASGYVPDDLPPLPPRKPVPVINDIAKVPMSAAHRDLIAAISKTGYATRVETDSAGSTRFQLHTYGIKEAKHPGTSGFSTISKGENPGIVNAYGYPIADGKILVCRHNNIHEPSWDESAKGTWYAIIGGTEDFAPVPIGEFVDQHPDLSPPLIYGLVRLGETMNIVASPKIGKSWLVYCIALSIATGRDLFGFPCRRGKVLLIDNELSPSVIADRIPRVASAMGITPDQYRDRIDVISLRGRLLDLQGIDSHVVSKITPGTYDAVILDAWYRANPGGAGGENDNASVTSAYNSIDQFAARTGAGWILVHHLSKGSQHEKSVTDTGAGAGAQSRATDCHAAIREHQEPGHVVLDARVRSFPPIEPIVLRWDFPLWTVADGHDPRQLRDPRKAQERVRDSEGKATILDALANQPDSITSLSKRLPMSRARIEKILTLLLADGSVLQSTETRKGNECGVYRLNEDRN